MRLLPAALCLAALPALAAMAETPPISPEAFDALSQGKTLSYAIDGKVYGTEVYKPGHKVIFAFTDEECREGSWYARGNEVCFIYEDPNDPQCWLYFQRGDGLYAQFTADGPDSPLSQVEESSEPLACMGPKIGA